MSRASESPGNEVCAAALQQRFGVDTSCDDVLCDDVLCDVVSVDGDPAGLLRAEQELVARAVPARQREFAAGRACARALLARLGFEPAPLLRATDGAPLWPRGAIGSIAHDGRRCAVVVARAGPGCSIGLDIEPDEPLEDELWPELFRPRELATLAACARRERGRVARVLFSAKECVYKCTRARLHATLGFREVEILLAHGSERFQARLHPRAGAALASAVLEGFHLACVGSILTGMTLTAAPVRPARRLSAAVSARMRARLHAGQGGVRR